MASAFEIRTEYHEGDNWTTLGLVNSISSSTALQQVEISSVAVSVWDVADDATDIYTPADPDPTAVFYNSLQTDYGWSFGDGYNFRHTIDPTSSLTATKYQGGHTYKIVYLITTVSEGKYTIVHWASILPIGSV